MTTALGGFATGRLGGEHTGQWRRHCRIAVVAVSTTGLVGGLRRDLPIRRLVVRSCDG